MSKNKSKCKRKYKKHFDKKNVELIESYLSIILRGLEILLTILSIVLLTK